MTGINGTRATEGAIWTANATGDSDEKINATVDE